MFLGMAFSASPVRGQTEGQERPIVVGSKPFAESLLLGEMFAQLLEDRGYVVDRRLGLGNTELIFQAVRTGAVDVYPEYTGTGLLAILGEEPSGSAREVFQRVASEFRAQWDIHWLPGLGFQNTYAMAVTPETAEAFGLSNLSELAAVGGELIGGLSPDFIGRADGLPGLEQAYGLEPREVRALLQAIKYEALVADEVDFVDGYSTDGLISRYDLVVLEDDLGFFPPYEAAPIISSRLAAEMPGAALVLTEMAGGLSDSDMQMLNRRTEVDGESVEDVARDALISMRLIEGPSEEVAPEVSRRQAEGLFGYLWSERGALGVMALRHLLLVSVSMFFAVLVAVPFGLFLEGRRAHAESAIRAVGALQTIPGIALLAFMIPLFGIGVLPAVAALFLYSLFPIVRNTFTGVRDASPEAVQAAEAIGMTEFQLLRFVRLPLAAPTIMAGIRTATVINIGTATLAAFIGAGGLGDPIVTGLALADSRMIISGALPAAVLALCADWVLGRVELGLTPSGLRTDSN